MDMEKIKEYDNNDRLVYYRTSTGFEEWFDFDSNGSELGV
jgi:hypothetical protein